MPKLTAATAQAIASIGRLHKPLGDSPLAGKQRYRVTPSGQPRALRLQVYMGLKRGFNRLACAIAPSGKRAEQQFRRELTDCSHRTGDFLACVSRGHGADTWSLRQSAVKCFQAADKPVLLEQTATGKADAVVEARLEVHLSAMNLDELAELKVGLRRLTDGPDNFDPQSKDLLSKLAVLVEKQFDAREKQAVEHLLKALVHPDGAMRGSQTLQACVDKFSAIAAARALSPPTSLIVAVADHLRDLSTPELKALGRSLGFLDTSEAKALPAPLLQTLRSIRLELQRDLCARLVEGARDTLSAHARKMLSTAVNSVDAATKLYGDFESQVDSLLATHPLATTPLSTVIAKHILDSLLIAEPELAPQFEALFGQLDPQRQKELIGRSSPVFGKDPVPLARLMRDKVASVKNRTEQDFSSLATRLLDEGKNLQRKNPTRFVQICIQAGQAWESLQRQVKVHAQSQALSVDPATSTQHENLGKFLQAHLNLDAVPLDSLSDDTLPALLKGLRALGAGAKERPVVQESIRRVADALQRCQDCQTEMLQSIVADGSPQEVFTALRDARFAVNRELRLIQALSPEPIDPAELWEISADAREHALNQLSNAQLTQLWQTLEAPACQYSAELFGTVGSAMVVDQQRGIGALLSDVGQTHNILLGEVMDRLERVPHEKPLPSLRTKIPPSQAELFAQAQQIASSLFKLNIPFALVGRTPQVAGRQIQAIARQELDDQSAQPEQLHALSSTPDVRIPARMTHQFVRELRSADFAVEFEEGVRQPLLNTATLASQGTPEYLQQMAQASTKLLALVDGDEEWLYQVSRFCHQGLLSVSQKAQQPERSPFELNGVRGQVVKGAEGQELSAYTLRREGDRILVRGEYTITKPEYLIDPLSGDTVELDPELSGARFSIEIAVSRDGTVEIVSPVTVASALHAKAA